jgi:hypothetical protein
MRPAFPAPEYYGGSVPPARPAGIAPVRPRLPGKEAWTEPSRAVPAFTADRSAGPAPGSAPAASPRLPPQAFTVTSHPRLLRPGQEFPPARHEGRGCAPQPSPYPPDLSWRDVKRRNTTGFSRMPSRFAHRARPVRQYPADATSPGLLPPSPRSPVQASSSFTLLLRQQGDGVLSPPPGQTAPRGAPATIPRCPACQRPMTATLPRCPSHPRPHRHDANMILRRRDAHADDP